MPDFVLKLLDGSFQICNLNSLLIDGLIELGFSLLVLPLEISDVFIELVDLLIQLVPLSVPLACLAFLSFKPIVMFSLCMIEVFFKFVNCSFMEASHLLNLQV